MRRRSHPLARELLRHFSIVVSIPLLITVFFYWWIFLPSLQNQLATQQNLIARVIASQSSSFLSGAQRQLQGFLDSGWAEDRLKNHQQDLRFIDLGSYFEALYFVDKNGLINAIDVRENLELARTLYLGLDVSSAAYLQDGIDEVRRQHRWSNAFLSSVTGRLSIAFLTGYQDGIAVAEVAIDRLPQISGALDQGEQLVMILDARQEIIAHPDSLISQQQENLSQISLFDGYAAGDAPPDNVSGYFKWRGQDYFGTSIRIPQYNWSVVVAEERNSFLKPLHRGIFLWLCLMLLLVMLTMISARHRATILSRRFQVFRDLAGQVAQGHYQVAPVNDRITEFNQVGESLIAMAGSIRSREFSLQESQRKLVALNEQLEHRVEERTRALRESKEELESTLETLHSTMGQLLQSEKMAALGQLVAGVAHEMNTPIGNALMASTSLSDFSRRLEQDLESGKLKKSDLLTYLEDARNAAVIISRNLEKAGHLISSFKQVAVDQSSDQRREFQVLELLEEIVLTQRPVLKSASVSVHLDVDPEIRMNSFPGALGQVVGNLISNACVHAFDEESAERNIIITVHALGDRALECDFCDNGRGIPEAHRKQIFDPFFTTRRGQGGSGLGLHIVHNLVTEALGGQIELRASGDTGTCFRFTLPLSRETVPT